MKGSPSFFIIIILVGLLLLLPGGASSEENTYPEEVHQRVLEKLSKLHGNSVHGRVGEWSDWSTWTPCSRSCGTGVSTQYRECLPSRKRERTRNVADKLKNQCVGRYKRFQLCNMKICRNGLGNFRAEQCSAFNKTPFNNRVYTWEPFIDDVESCTLNCRAVGMSFYATLNQSVVDGTPCGDFQPLIHHNSDSVCVEGKCMKVGCDGLLGSGRVVDACGVCGGDNSTCRLISGVYSRANLPFGYNLIATLPPGAKNLSIYHVKPSSNHLALRELGGNYILNGPWGLNDSGSFEASGTTFIYSRPHVHGGDHLYAGGPTTHSLDVMLFYQNTNPGIKYEYRLPLSSIQRLPSRVRGGVMESHNRVVIRRGPPTESSSKILPGILPQVKDGHFERPNDPVLRYPSNLQSLQSPSHLLLADDPTRYASQPSDAVHNNKFMPFASQGGVNRGYSYPQSSLSRGFDSNYFNATFPIQSKLPFKQKTLSLRGQNSFPYSPELRANPGHNSFPYESFSPNNWRSRFQNTLNNYISPGYPRTPEMINRFPHNPHHGSSSLNPSIKYHYNSVLPQHGPQFRPFSSPLGNFLPSKSQSPPSSANPLPSSFVTNHAPDNKLSANKHSPYIPHSNSVFPAQRESKTSRQGIIADNSRRRSGHLYLEGNKIGWSSKPDYLTSEKPAKIPKLIKRKGGARIHREPSTRKRYMWVSKGFTLCSRSCGSGTQSTRNVCVKRKRKEIEVPPHFCANLRPPREQVVRCNFKPCPPEWEATEWSECSVTCGLGVQVRKLICKQRTASDLSLSLADNECGTIATIPTAQVCQMRDCDGPPIWDVGPWSACSSQCGLGTRRRKITCTTVHGIVEDKLCKDPGPIDEEICDMGSCASDTWFFSSWDASCHGPCGEGIQKRRVHCSGDALEGKESLSCLHETKPPDTRGCSNERECGGSWFAGPWGECDARCGTGRQLRAIVCVTWHRGRYKVAKSAAFCKAAGEKPQDTRPCAVDCRAEWFTSEWSQCSLPCDGGVQRREVKCLNYLLQPSIECPTASKPDSRQSCNAHSCNSKAIENRLKNEVLNPMKHLPNDSSSVSNDVSGKFNSGKTYEYHKKRETLYINNETTELDYPETFQEYPETIPENVRNVNVSQLQSETWEESQIERNVVINERDVNAVENKRNVSCVTEMSSLSDNSRKVENVTKRTEWPSVSPQSPLRTGACIDRMKNCRLVFKARLCKLKYYNKLCCETCTKH